MLRYLLEHLENTQTAMLTKHECFEAIYQEAPEAMKEVLNSLSRGEISVEILTESLMEALPSNTPENIRVALARAIEHAGSIARGDLPYFALPSHTSPFFYQPLAGVAAMSPKKNRHHRKLH